MSIEQIEGESGLYEIRKLKQLYYACYGERYSYIINLDTGKGISKEINNERRNRRN